MFHCYLQNYQHENDGRIVVVVVVAAVVVVAVVVAVADTVAVAVAVAVAVVIGAAAAVVHRRCISVCSVVVEFKMNTNRESGSIFPDSTFEN